MKKLVVAVTVLFAFAIVVVPTEAALQGQYVEVRSADVYTGPCYANSEVGLEGKQAILAWSISQGAWHGVNLAGLNVVAVVDARSTLGDPYHNPYPARTILIVDQKATASQRQALAGFVKSAAGRLAQNIIRVDVAPIRMEFGEGATHGAVTMTAGSLARIETRSLCAGDHLCGNEELYYPPLTNLRHAMAAYTLNDAFEGQGLGMVWNRHDARSAYVGTFTL